MIKAIVFDFDGVIVRGSEFYKEKGWNQIFPSRVSKEAIAARDRYSGGKGSRFDIIRELAPSCGIPPNKIDEWIISKAKEYGEFTAAATIREGVISDDLAALRELSVKYFLYINSATPESILLDIVEKLGIESIFRKKFGQRNPNSKIENMKRVAEDSEVSATEIIFVGDQNTDFDVAKEFGCPFVGIMNEWNMWDKTNKTFPLISGVKDLPAFLSA